MSKFAVLAEKENAGRDIAKAFHFSKEESIGKSRFIKGILSGDEYYIVWTKGHCLELQEPEEIDVKYKKWVAEDLPVPFTDNILNVKADKGLLYKELRDAISGCDSIINAGDSGREGELIQRWLIDKIYGKNPPPIYRLWAQSTSQKELERAIDNLLTDEEVFDNLYAAGSARAIMDKYLGYNYSRLISLTKTDGITVNYGRCKSPITRAIIERDLEVENFKAVPFSHIKIVIDADGTEVSADLIDEKKRRRDFAEDEKQEAERIVKEIAAKVTVTNITKTEKSQSAPLLFDILTLQKDMSKKYNYEADETLAICQALYDKHHILSYPRTDSRYLTPDIRDDLMEVYRELNFGEYKDLIKDDAQIPDKHFNAKKVADHHALVPVIPDTGFKVTYDRLSDKEKNVLDAVIKSFISIHYPPYLYESVITELDDANHQFIVKGINVKEEGWKEVYRNDTAQDDEEEQDIIIPAFTENGNYDVIKAELIEDQTKPKKRFTTATLLDFMKVNHIGTGATRDTILKELLEKKGYNKESTVIKDGKYYVSTNFGRQINKIIPEDLTSIEYLSKLESDLADIEAGNISKAAFLRGIDEDFKQKKRKMMANPEVLMAKALPEDAKSKFTCPVCGEPLYDKGWGYSCGAWKKDGSGCNFSIGKKYFSTKISDKVIEQLISEGKSKNTLTLKKKDGKGTYKAYLTFTEKDGSWKMGISFE